MIYRFANFALDTELLELRSAQGLVRAEPQVFSLLVYLIENRSHVVSKEELIEAVWEERIVSDDTLNSRINAARRAVGDTGTAQAVIRTFPRRGFRFVAEIDYLQAADAYASYGTSINVADLYETRRLIQLSLSIDANYARSYSILAFTHCAAWINAYDSDFLKLGTLDRAHQFARKAVRLDPNLPLAHACLGFVFMVKHQHEASVAEFERAIALNPNYVDWRFGLALVFAGDSIRAIDVVEAYMRLDPFYRPLASGILGLAHYMLKRYAQALPMLREFVARAPKLRLSHVWLAATHAQLGLVEEARAEVAEVLRLQPNYTIAGTGRRLVAFKSAEDDKRYFDGLRKAGLPE